MKTIAIIQLSGGNYIDCKTISWENAVINASFSTSKSTEKKLEIINHTLEEEAIIEAHIYITGLYADNIGKAVKAWSSLLSEGVYDDEEDDYQIIMKKSWIDTEST